MTTVDYDELADDYYATCDCGWTGPGHLHRRDADLNADRHDEHHDDGAI